MKFDSSMISMVITKKPLSGDVIAIQSRWCEKVVPDLHAFAR